MSEDKFYICSYEFPRPTLLELEENEIDGPLEYVGINNKFVLNDSIYAKKPYLKENSYCYLNVPVYIINHTKNKVLYNYSDERKTDINTEKRNNKELAHSLNKSEELSSYSKEDLKAYLLNIFYNLEEGVKYIPVSVYDSINYNTYIFIYPAYMVRSTLFPEFGQRKYCPKSIGVSQFVKKFNKPRIVLNSSKLKIKLNSETLLDGGIYVLYANGKSEYILFESDKTRLVFNSKSIKSLVFDFARHSEYFLVL